MHETLFISEEDGKRRLLLAALSLFTEHGIGETSIAEVARRAGSTEECLYQYFDSREGLSLYLFNAAYRHLLEQLDVKRQTATDIDERLRMLVESTLTYFDESPDAVMFVFDYARRFYRQVPAALKRTSIPILAAQISRDHGRAGADETAHEAFAMTVTGTLGMLVRMIHLHELRGPAARWTDEVTASLRRALG
jgi:AcrR family transcriptional regulator